MDKSAGGLVIGAIHGHHAGTSISALDISEAKRFNIPYFAFVGYESKLSFIQATGWGSDGKSYAGMIDLFDASKFLDHKYSLIDTILGNRGTFFYNP